MGDEYRKLALRLDAIPNGFPATESGVELDLLAKIFTPEEAEIASVMRLTPEAASEIAGRVNLVPDTVTSVLERMLQKGVIIGKKVDGTQTFGLQPFIVGIYEQQLGRIDEELAQLFEQYYQETRGAGMIGVKPALHRVVPVNKAIPFEIEIFPYEEASRLIETAQSWGLRKCICRVQRQLIGKGCDYTVDNCIMFAPVEGAFDHAELTRAVSKDDALSALREADEAGLVHATANYQGVHFYICNCCPCCCGVLRGLTEFGNPSSIARSSFQASVDCNACTGCGTCLERCHFGALSIPDETCVVDPDRCLGCGLCASACPEGALRLQRRPEHDQVTPPADHKTWLVERAQERNIDLSDIL
jgi:ferredoxin